MSTIALESGLYNPQTRTLHRHDGSEQRLSPTEGKLLDYLAERPGQTVPYAELLAEVWGYARSVESRTIFTTIGRLRQKIEGDPAEPRHIIALSGSGYRFEPLERAAPAQILPRASAASQREARAWALLAADGPPESLEALSASEGARAASLDGLRLWLFERSTDAIAAARQAAQRGARLLLREVSLPSRPDGSVDAEPLDVESALLRRLLGASQPGMILATEEVAACAPPQGLAFAACGRWRTRGLSRVFALAWLTEEPARADLVAPVEGEELYPVALRDGLWMPLRELKRRLPAERDRFVGRQAELLDLERTLDEGARLVSICGPGGSGKTRLATHFGWSQLGEWPGGVWFCELSDARTEEDIVRLVASALDVPLDSGDPAARVGHALAGRDRCLVILDNFEQIADLAHKTAGAWLQRAKDAVFVVTTRQRLHLTGEVVFALPPMPVEEGERLFYERARAVLRGFSPSEEDERAVRQLVELLEGNALAIELAAARVNLMSPAKMLSRIGARLQWLSAPAGRPARQGTLRATIDWSYQLLSEEEQRALQQLSVFEGGFTIEAAEAVLLLRELPPIDALQSLLDRSLVRKLEGERLDLLVSVKEYATEKLGEREATERREAEQRHARHFASFGTPEAIDAAERAGGALRALSFEIDNLAAAIRRSASAGDGRAAAEALAAAWEVLALSGPLALALDLAQSVLSAQALPDSASAAAEAILGNILVRMGRLEEAVPHFVSALGRSDVSARGRLHGKLAALHVEQGRPAEATVHIESGLEATRAASDRNGEARILTTLGTLLRNQRRYAEAEVQYAAALEAAVACGDLRVQGRLLGHRGNMYMDLQRYDEARADLERSLAVDRALPNRAQEGVTLTNIGNLFFSQGLRAEAAEYYKTAIAIVREIGDLRAEARALGNLGAAYESLGQPREAEQLYIRALRANRELGNRRAEATTLGNLGALLRMRGLEAEAREHHEAAIVIYRSLGDRRGEGLAISHLGNLWHSRGRLDEAARCYERAMELAREARDRRGEAVALCNLGRSVEALGRHEEALARFEASLEIARALSFRALEGALLRFLAERLLDVGRLSEARPKIEIALGHLADGDIPSLGSLLCVRARLERAEGDRERARETLREVEAVLESLGAGPEAPLRRELEAARALVEA